MSHVAVPQPPPTSAPTTRVLSSYVRAEARKGRQAVLHHWCWFWRIYRLTGSRRDGSLARGRFPDRGRYESHREHIAWREPRQQAAPARRLVLP